MSKLINCELCGQPTIVEMPDAHTVFCRDCMVSKTTEERAVIIGREADKIEQRYGQASI